MESKVAEASVNSNVVGNVKNSGIDVRSQLMKAMECQWAKANSVSLAKKKTSRRKVGKVRKTLMLIFAAFDLLTC